MSDTLYTVTQLAKDLGVTARTVRFYEDKGLLTPARKGQTRVYDARDRARLKLILRGRRFGFSLEEIRQWLQMREEAGTEAQMRAFVALAKTGNFTLAAQAMHVTQSALSDS